MTHTIRAQLAEINLGYEVLIEQFIKNMMEFPGCMLNVPLPVFKGQSNDMWNDEKQLICDRTAELLTMMGIKHVQSKTAYQMMVEIDG